MSRYRDWCWQYAPKGKEDSGAYDEGYYYHFCFNCNEKTEHETGNCCKCQEYNDPEYWEDRD